MKNRCVFKILYSLYKEIKELRERNDDLFKQSFGLRYYVGCVSSNYEGARGAIEQILKNPNSDKNSLYYAKIALNYMDMRKDVICKYKSSI